MKMLFAALCAVVVAATAAHAEVKTETIAYKQGDTALEGWLIHDDAVSGKRPGIVLYPAWWGPSVQDKESAARLVKMGYVVFVADIYGKGVRPDAIPTAGAEAKKYYKDRPLALARARAAFDQLRQSPLVEAGTIGAIGFCFGAMPALDLARSGAPLVAVISVHGSLATPNPASDKNIKGRVLALQGSADPFVNAQAVATFEKELTEAGVDWQVNIYGGAMHAYTDHMHAQAPAMGIKYDAEATKRSWLAIRDFLRDTLS